MPPDIEDPPAKRNLWGQRGSIALPPIKLAADGTKLCRWCWEPVPKRRQFWCGKGCVTDYRQRADWSFIREQIIERDKVCRLCGGCRYACKGGKWFAETGRTLGSGYRFRRENLHGIPLDRLWGRFNLLVLRWEVDHIRAIVDGGTDEPSNLRLLCTPCHQLRTAVWLRDRAANRQATLALD